MIYTPFKSKQAKNKRTREKIADLRDRKERAIVWHFRKDYWNSFLKRLRRFWQK